MLRLLAVILSLSSHASFSYAKPISAEAANAGATSDSAAAQGQLSTEGVSTYDGVALSSIPAAVPAVSIIATAISQAGWVITVDSANAGNPGTAAIDGTNTTFWHTQYQPTVAALPHTATINMGKSYLVGSITYTPRQDGNANGRIGQHIISLR